MGYEERDRIRVEQLQKQREADKLMREEHEKKLLAQVNKTDIEVDFNFADEDRDSALFKMTESAVKVTKLGQYRLHTYLHIGIDKYIQA
jgi:hypothetical protein